MFSLDTLEFDFNNSVKTKIIDKGNGIIEISGNLNCDVSSNKIILNNSEYSEFKYLVENNVPNIQSLQNNIIDLL